MNIAIITLTKEGFITAQRIVAGFDSPPHTYVFKKMTEGNDSFIKKKMSTHITPFSEPLHQLVNRIFKQYDGLVFIMAMGIVVRVIAQNIQDKYTDPAVVVVDDVGRFVISVLSGHEGGANLLAHRIAAIMHTDAVITTGTEAKKDIIIGVGCKKGVNSEAVKQSIFDALQKVNLTLERVRLLSTIEIKSEEPGLLRAAEELDIPLRIVSCQEIAACAKEHGKSNFVKEKIGVWGVCEPAALLSGRKTQLLLKKQKYPGVTVAIARENFMW
ncbi:MAG: cobalamin biosynthesis protein CbiG [Candidatus Brocadia sp.]|nr:MAG: cobalamin biosynthesis protein CbiG [Candidatus Brocadia sp.]